MDVDAISERSSDSSLANLHHQITHQSGWFDLRQTANDHWYPSALTRITLLVGHDEVLWIFGNRDTRTLVVLTESALIVCEHDGAEDSPAIVTRLPRSSVRQVQLLGGGSPFGTTSFHSEWPGPVEMILEFGGRDPVRLDIRDFRASKVADAWEALMPAR